jgi:hypothetical protein
MGDPRRERAPPKRDSLLATVHAWLWRPAGFLAAPAGRILAFHGRTRRAFQTTGCGRYDHRELTLQLVRTMVPGIERMLLSYVEGAVAKGKRFEPGQTIQLGWGTLRVVDRPDGMPGLEERVDPESWTGWR